MTIHTDLSNTACSKPSTRSGTTSSIRASVCRRTAAGGHRWSPRRGGSARGGPVLQRADAARTARSMPPPGRDQRVRHQRPREPHQLPRRPGPQLPRRRAQGLDVPDDVPIAKCRRCSTSFGTRTAGSPAAGDRPPHGPRRRSVPAVLRRPDGLTRVRFVEPEQVATPPELARPRGQLRHSDRARRRRNGRRLLHRRRARRRRRHPAPQGERRRQREARPAAVLARAQEPAPGRKAAAQHEHRGRDPIGDRADPQAPRRQPQRHRAVRRHRRRCHHSRMARPAARATTRNTAPARSSTPPPASNTTSPPRGVDAATFVTVLQAELRAIAAGW